MTKREATPLWLLTGFLGSGKTTLLAHLLEHPRLQDTAIIVNEFGEVGLDHLLVASAEEENVVLLENGCLCCEVQNGLAETLDDLFYRRARGGVVAFSRVIVETTGLADPGPILASLIGDRHRATRFPLAGTIAVVDADQGLDRLDRYAEAARQVALADRIVVTRLDLTRGEVPRRLEQKLDVLNPRAQRLFAEMGRVDPNSLLAPPATSLSSLPSSLHHSVHSPSIGTVFIPLPDPLSLDQYGDLVAAIAALGPSLLRTKGAVLLAGEDGPFAIQGVGQLFAEPSPLPRWAGGRLGLVLIGEGLDEKMVGRIRSLSRTTGGRQAS